MVVNQQYSIQDINIEIFLIYSAHKGLSSLVHLQYNSQLCTVNFQIRLLFHMSYLLVHKLCLLNRCGYSKDFTQIESWPQSKVLNATYIAFCKIVFLHKKTRKAFDLEVAAEICRSFLCSYCMRGLKFATNPYQAVYTSPVSSKFSSVYAGNATYKLNMSIGFHQPDGSQKFPFGLCQASIHQYTTKRKKGSIDRFL